MPSATPENAKALPRRRPVADALSAPPASGYHAAFDRSAPAEGADVWDAGPADGVISAGDITLVVAQFGHTCLGAP